MSNIVNYLHENNITNYSIFHKRIKSSMVSDGKLSIDLFDRVIDSSDTNKKVAVYFMFNNLCFDDNLDWCMNENGLRALNYYKYVQQYQHMTKTNDNVYMYSFSFHPTNSISTNGYTIKTSLPIEIHKHNGCFEVSENSAITYVVQYVQI
jgi:hypothetical protein